MNWYLEALKKYVVIDGRARRKEYWFFVLFYIIIVFVLGFIDGMTGISSGLYGAGLLSSIFALAMIIPSITVGVRRLHDTDRTGWWILLAFIPLIGGIWLLILFVLDSTPGDNKYGPNPQEVVTQ